MVPLYCDRAAGRTNQILSTKVLGEGRGQTFWKKMYLFVSSSRQDRGWNSKYIVGGRELLWSHDYSSHLVVSYPLKKMKSIHHDDQNKLLLSPLPKRLHISQVRCNDQGGSELKTQGTQLLLSYCLPRARKYMSQRILAFVHFNQSTYGFHGVGGGDSSSSKENRKGLLPDIYV